MFRDYYPINLLNNAVGPTILSFVTNASETIGGVTADLSNLPFIGGLISVVMAGGIAVVRSYVGRVKQNATAEVQNMQGHLSGLTTAKARAEQEVSKLQGQISGLQVEKQDISGEILKLKEEMLDMRNTVDSKDEYIRQLQYEKAESDRWIKRWKELQEQRLIPRVE